MAAGSTVKEEDAKKRKAESVDGACLSLFGSRNTRADLEDELRTDAKKKLKPTPSTTKSTQPTAASLFAAKPALPSFKKEKKPDVPSSAPPSFAAALAAMEKKKASVPVKEEKSTGGMASGSGGKTKPKRKKSVRWRADEELEAIRWIERREETLGANGEIVSHCFFVDDDEEADECELERSPTRLLSPFADDDDRTTTTRPR